MQVVSLETICMQCLKPINVRILYIYVPVFCPKVPFAVTRPKTFLCASIWAEINSFVEDGLQHKRGINAVPTEPNKERKLVERKKTALCKLRATKAQSMRTLILVFVARLLKHLIVKTLSVNKEA